MWMSIREYGWISWRIAVEGQFFLLRTDASHLLRSPITFTITARLTSQDRPSNSPTICDIGSIAESIPSDRRDTSRKNGGRCCSGYGEGYYGRELHSASLDVGSGSESIICCCLTTFRAARILFITSPSSITNLTSATPALVFPKKRSREP